MIKDRFNIILKAPAVKILYISFPNPASDAFPNTKPCLQNSWAGSILTLSAPGKLIEDVNDVGLLNVTRNGNSPCKTRQARHTIWLRHS